MKTLKINNMKTLTILKTILLLAFTAIVLSSNAQEAQEEIDTSKPTNFYSFIENNVEFQSTKNANIFGYRGNLTLAPSEAHLILAEVPVLYNDNTKGFGLGDLRARYFFLPYKNYDKLIGAFGPSVDVFAPTGDFSKGLGSDSWIVSPGITVGIMAHEKFQFFPILSYQYKSDPLTIAGKNAGLTQTHGMSFQVITPIVFSEKFFVQITPNIKINDFSKVEVSYVQEALASYSITPTLQASAYYQGDFTQEAHTLRVGLTVFF